MDTSPHWATTEHGSGMERELTAAARSALGLADCELPPSVSCCRYARSRTGQSTPRPLRQLILITKNDQSLVQS